MLVMSFAVAAVLAAMAGSLCIGVWWRCAYVIATAVFLALALKAFG